MDARNSRSQLIRRQAARFWIVAMLVGCSLPVKAAQVALRLTTKDGALQAYYDKPDAFPVCKTKLDLLSLTAGADAMVLPDGRRLFDTKRASIEVGRGDGRDRSFTGQEVVHAIANWEENGFEVTYAVVYREDWLFLNGSGGPWKEDIRLLSEQELGNIRAALKASHLKSKDTVKLVQLLGARVRGHRGDTWADIRKNQPLVDFLKKFDGLGTECHVGDQTDAKRADGPRTLESMAQIARWAKDNGRDAFVFMGGGPDTYRTPSATQETYGYLWDKMNALGVDKKNGHLIYFRQGGRPGAQLPEGGDTLTGQMKWLIEQVR